MAKTIKADKLRTNVMSLLEDYAEDVETATADAIEKTAKKTVKQLRTYRPEGAEAFGSWAKYLKGWTSREETASRYLRKRIIYNKSHWRLAHLLEKGHNDKTGRKVARPFEHVKIAEDKAKAWILQDIEKEIGNT